MPSAAPSTPPPSAFDAAQQLCADARLPLTVGARVRSVDPEDDPALLGTIVSRSHHIESFTVRWDSGVVANTGGKSLRVVTEPPAAPRFWVKPCARCHGAGHLPDRHHDQHGEHTRTCDDCEGVGATLERARGSYAATAGQPAQLKGDPLPALTDCRDRLLDWARGLTEHLQQDGARYTWAAEQRDDLVLIAGAIDEAADRADAAAHLSEQLEIERQRYEALSKQLRLLDAALRLEQKMRSQDEVTRQELVTANQQLRSEVSHQRLESEAARVAVHEATQAVLDAGAALSIERARAALDKAS